VGRGRIAWAVRREVLVALEDIAHTKHPPAPAVHLGFAVPKGKRLDWLLEKATELGAASLRPVVFERSVAAPDLNKAKAEKWRAACIAAAKQCGLDFLPEINAPEGFRHFLEECADMVCLLGDTGRDALSLPAALDQSSIVKRQSVILVGPEGGLTDAERRQALAAGFRPVRIGANTLRVETAGVAMLAAVTALLPDAAPMEPMET